MPDQQTGVEAIWQPASCFIKGFVFAVVKPTSYPTPGGSTSYFTPHKNIIASRKANNG